MSTAHRVGVDLTHIPAAVSLVHVLDVQVPGAMVVEGQGDARVLRYHVVVDRENCLRVHANPRHLQYN